MHKASIVLPTLAMLLMIVANASAQSPSDPVNTIVRINGPAYRAVSDQGAGFRAEQLLPVAPHNPSRATWQATLEHRALHLAQGAVPENIQVSRDGRVQGASNPVTDYSEVMVAIDPTDGQHLLAASKFFYRPAQYDFFTGVFESYDGGRTWRQEQPDGVEDFSLTSDPVTTFDHEGNGYFTLLSRGPRAGRSGLEMMKKPAAGDWGEPVLVDETTVTDKQWIIGDQDPLGESRYAGHVYMSWTAIGLQREPSRIMFSRSTNGNRSWRAPLEIAQDHQSDGGVQGSIPGVAPDGSVYVLYGRNIFGGPGRGTLEIVRSRNGGQTFDRVRTVAQITTIPFFLPNGLPDRNFRTPGSLPAFAASPTNGYLYAAWADYRNGDADILLARSTNEGINWDPPVRLNGDPVGNGVDQFQPQVSVAPNGRVAVMWMDRRLPCPDEPWIEADRVGQENTCIDTFMTRSDDDGQTWEPNIRVSEQTWDWRMNLPMVDRSTGFIGDYQGIASSEGYDYPVWAATANLGDNPDNRQQIFVARVPAEWVPSTPAATATPTSTSSETAAASATVEPISSPTSSPSSTAEPTAVASRTPEPSASPARTRQPTIPPSWTAEPTLTVTATATSRTPMTPQPSPSPTPSQDPVADPIYLPIAQLGHAAPGSD